MTTLGNTFLSNSFKQAPVRGQEDLKLNENKFAVILNNADTTQVTSAGDMVKLVATENGGLPSIAEVTPTETYSNTIKYGFIPFGRLKNDYITGEIATICCTGCVMYMIAEGNIECGQQVFYDAKEGANQGKVMAVAGELQQGQVLCGTALDKASQDGDLIRVMIL